MPEERIEENVVDTPDTSVDYIAAIKSLKENSVSKEAFAKLQDENRKLVQSLINGETIQQDAPKKEIDVEAIEKKLASKTPMMKSIDGFKMILELREADLAAGKPDPFLPLTKKSPTQADLDACQHRAEVYQEIIDYAEGDPALFAQELSRRMVDVPLPKRR